MNNIKKKHQIIPIEFVLYVLSFQIFLLVSRGIFAMNKPYNDNVLMAIYIPIFVVAVAGLGFFLFYDFKANSLKVEKKYIIIFAAISLSSLISMCCLPNTVLLPYDATISVSISDRIYSIVYGVSLGICPFLAFYVIPRKFRHKKYIEIFLMLVLSVVVISFVYSLYSDFKNYTATIKSGFSNMNNPCISFFTQKNLYGRFLFAGIIAAIFLHIFTNKFYWLLFLVPFEIAEIFSFAKMPLFLSTLLIIGYIIIRLIPIIKRNKDNLKITLIILTFVVLMIVVLSVLTAYSQTGILFKIKNVLSNFVGSAKNTLKTRFVIWECSFKLMKPFQYIFGFSYVMYGNAIHAVYDTRHLEDTRFIWNGHNSVVEIMGQGGIIYLLINILMVYWVIKYSIKIMKNNLFLGVTNIFVLCLLFIQGLTDSIMLFNEGDNLLIMGTIVVPIMAEYYNHYDKDEIKLRHNMLADCKTLSKWERNNIIDKANIALHSFAYRYMKTEYKQNSK